MTPALLALGCALTWAGRVYVQRRAGRPPAPWALVELAVVVLPAVAAWSQSAPLAACSVALGAVVLAVGVAIGRQVDAVVDDARIGERERAARRVLRRPSPPEVERMQAPITSGIDLDALRATLQRRADRAMRASGAPDSVSSRSIVDAV